MKIVINESYGCFHVSEQFCKHYNIPYDVDGIFGVVTPKESITRTDKRLIEYIKNTVAMRRRQVCLVLW